MLTGGSAPAEMLQEAMQTFFGLSIAAVGIGTIVTTQGAIVGEKQLGTAAWVISKPASRTAFILAKTLAYAIGYGITAILIPATIFFFTTRQLVPAPFSLMPFLAGVALVALGQLFYLTLTLMLGTLFGSRGPVAGIGIAIIMTGLLLNNLIPLEIVLATPWLLPDIANGLVLGTPLPSIWFVPILATSFWILVMTTVALWRFGREEF
jgi:ABC-2 type transport system permease protein